MSSTDLETTSLESRAEMFGALSDPIRLSVLDELARGQRCVCELQEELDIAPNLLSYHLRILREAGLVEATRRGRWVDYRLSEDAGAMVAAALPSPLGEVER
jgi:ArsR family transcriptional regulator, arsenate/arsenite/antimonite-responsive transcriptional repressor